mgnify:CR=1 FL=1
MHVKPKNGLWETKFAARRGQRQLFLFVRLAPRSGKSQGWGLSFWVQRRNVFAHSTLFLSHGLMSHTDLTNLTDSASLRPRLSALPSVFSRMAHTSVSACDLRDSRDLRGIQIFMQEYLDTSALDFNMSMSCYICVDSCPFVGNKSKNVKSK